MQGFGVHHALNPDPYRGAYGNDGPAYAADVADLISAATPGAVAGFFHETIQGVGGAVPLADGYLPAVYEVGTLVGGDMKILALLARDHPGRRRRGAGGEWLPACGLTRCEDFQSRNVHGPEGLVYESIQGRLGHNNIQGVCGAMPSADEHLPAVSRSEDCLCGEGRAEY